MSQMLPLYPFSERAGRTGDSPISWLMTKTVDDPEILSLAAGFVDQDNLPQEEIQGALNTILSTTNSAKKALQYGTTQGLTALREAMADRLQDQGIQHVNPERLLISNGGQQSLFTLTDVMVDVGDVVLVEDPTYFVYMDVLNSAGARTMGVATDEEGMIPESLQERFDQIRAMGLRDRLKVLYIMSYYTNPKGTNMSKARREELYEIFQRELRKGAPFILLEDASYRDLKLEGDDEPFIKSLDPDNQWVCVTGTFSKALAPGLRLGWSYMPGPIHQAVARQKGNQDFGSSNLNQNVVAHLLRSGGYDRAADRFRGVYRAKRDSLIEAMKEFWPADSVILKPTGGLYVWVQLPGIDTDPGTEFFNRTLDEKVLYVPGRYCYCDETQGPRPTDSMRICYGVVSEKPMREAVRRMGEVIKKFRNG